MVINYKLAGRGC